MPKRIARFLAPVLLCSWVALTAATPPAPPTTPPAAAGQMPVVMVYPFEVQTGADPKLGIAIAQILAQEMTAAGGISVPPVPQNVKRADFLEQAHAAHADFYISGYVTPVGDTAAVVEQVVSVESGVILFSQTAQVSSVADVASQSLLARSQILAFVGRGTQNVQAQAANTPAPTSTNGAQLPLRGIASIVDSVFKHRASSTPSPGPVTKPSRGVIVAPVSASGAIASADLTSAMRELYFAFNRHFNTEMTSLTTSDVAHSADQICGANRDNTVASGTLQEAATHHGRQDVTFNLAVYTCFGATLDREVGKGSSVKSAVDAAVAAYAEAHPDNS
jgi:TolB-like protein